MTSNPIQKDKICQQNQNKKLLGGYLARNMNWSVGYEKEKKSRGSGRSVKKKERQLQILINKPRQLQVEVRGTGRSTPQTSQPQTPGFNYCKQLQLECRKRRRQGFRGGGRSRGGWEGGGTLTRASRTGRGSKVPSVRSRKWTVHPIF